MKKKFPLPLKINCEGLSKKHALRLAWALEEHFDYVEIFGLLRRSSFLRSDSLAYFH